MKLRFFCRIQRCIAALAATVAIPVIAGPASYATVAEMLASSDAIVVGSVKGVAVNGRVDVTIDVERVLKGTISPGALVAVSSEPIILRGFSGPISTDHGLFFLKQTGSSQWSPLPIVHGETTWEDFYVRTPASPSVTVAVDASSQEKALAELVSALVVQGWTKLDVVYFARQAQSGVLTTAFRQLVTSSNPRLRIMGIRGLLATSDASAISALRSAEASLSSTTFWSDAVNELKFYYAGTDPATVATLGAMSTDASVSYNLRFAAAAALARIHTQAALPYLAKLLDDPLNAMQAAGVGGLANFANNVPIGEHHPAPGDWKYRTDDTMTHSAFDEPAISARGSYYIPFWKAWWQQNQTALSQ